MNKSLGIALWVVAGIILGALVFGVGMMIGRFSIGVNSFGSFNMMGKNFGRSGSTMMGNGFNMMERSFAGMNNRCAGDAGMMGGYFSGNTSESTPISVDQAKQAVESYLQNLNKPDLELAEIMIFDNNAYARIIEKSSGTGAMELLVDPSSLAVFPEFGPNMMWNLKYSPMNGTGMMGGFGGMMRGRGMMQGYSSNPDSVTAEMTITPEQALDSAQQYLDKEFPGYQTAEDADPFYGYYTIEILKDGQPTGMLSVNGFDGQVFLHSWHGNFIEMWE